MLRALAWKEWREQRLIILAGLAIGLALPIFLTAGAATRARGLDLGDVAATLPGFYAVLLWPLFATAAGASTLAPERGEGTLPFLLSRPVSRGRIWAVKVALGALSTLAIVVATGLFGGLFRIIVESSGARAMRPLIPWTSAQGGAIILGDLLLLFATSVFFSMLLPRPMTAAAAALAASLALHAGLLLLWSMADVTPRFEPGWLGLQMVFAAVLLLGGSLWVFARGEMLRGRRFHRRVLGASGVVVGLVVMGSVPLLYGALRLTPATAVFRDLLVTPDGRAIVARVTDDDWGSSQIWAIPADGAGYVRLTGRLTLAPEVSPDGQRVAYVSRRGAFGLRSDRAQLRIVDVDGSGDRLLLDDLGLSLHPAYDARWLEVPIAFSPDGTRLALLLGDRLDILEIDSGGRHRHDLPRKGSGTVKLVGWMPQGDEVLLYRHESDPGGLDGSLYALDVETGDTRELLRGGGILWPLLASSRQARSGKLVIVRLAGEDDDGRRIYEASILDLSTGRNEELVRGHCAARADLSDDGRWLAYAECAGADGTMLLRLRDLRSGDDRLVARTREHPMRIELSPRADRLLVATAYGDGVPSFTVELGGALHPLDPKWQPLGWTGRDRLLLLDRPAGRPPRLLESDPAGQNLRTLYP